MLRAMPLSVRVAWTLPMMISGSFICVACALISAFKDRSRVAPFGLSWWQLCGGLPSLML